MTYKSLISTIARLVVISAFIVIVLPLLAAPWDLDPTWDSDGVVLTDPFGLNEDGDMISKLLIQSDNKIIVAGFTYLGSPTYDTPASVVRYEEDGSLDNTFGNNGIVSLPTITPFGKLITSGLIALSADGKMVITGRFDQENTTDIIAVLRLHTNGTLDTTFGDAGYVAIDATNLELAIDGHSSASDIAIQPDGKIVITGTFNTSSKDMMLRLNEVGILDNTFGGNGIVSINPANNQPTRAQQILVQPDGKLLVTTEASTGTPGPGYTLLVNRFNSDGSPDLSFGVDGLIDLEMTISPRTAVRLQSDGKILLSSGLEADYLDVILIRLNSDGSLDDSFAGDGIALIDIHEDISPVIDLQADGKIVIAGGTFEYDTLTGAQTFISRYSSDGSPDMTFNGVGYFYGDLLPTWYTENPVALKIQRDGQVLVAIANWQDASPQPTEDFATLRFEGDTAFGYAELSPAHRISDVTISADLSLMFPEPVNINAGKIEIRRVADFSLFESIPITEVTRVSGGGTNSITINSGADFEPNTQYFVLVDPNTFTNAAGHPFSGVRELVEWHFTTGDAPPAPVNLVSNAGFENKAINNPKRAAKWTVSKLVSTDGRACNQPNKTPPVTVAYDDKCAFQFNHSVAKPRYIEQKVTLTEALEGQTMHVAGYIKRQGLTTGAAIQVQITYTDNSKATLKIAIPGGTKGYKPFENTLVLEQDAIKARVRIMTGKSKGRFLVDGLSLTVSDEAPLSIGDTPIPVPDAPDLRGN